MSKSQFEVQVYYSGYCSFVVEADSENDAIILARENPVNKDELFTNLENWKEANIATEVHNARSK